MKKLLNGVMKDLKYPFTSLLIFNPFMVENFRLMRRGKGRVTWGGEQGSIDKATLKAFKELYEPARQCVHVAVFSCF